jgi:hypothetical protein
MTRFTVILLALCLSFLAGWLFANEVRPPLLQDVGLAMWIAVGGTGLLSAMIAAGR